MKVKEFMTMNGIKDIYMIAKMTGSELAPMVVKSQDGESSRLRPNLWVYLWQRCTMHRRFAGLGSIEELEGIKHFS